MRKFAALLLLTAYGCGAWGQQECYVCRKDEPLADDLELDKQFPLDDLPFCGREPDARKVCPPDHSRGCYTETRGDKVLSKMCSGVEVSDCQEANNVNYCYCKGHLCNGERGRRAGGTPTTTVGPDTDDEDLSGGSGDGPGRQPTTTTPRLPTTTTGHPKGHPQAVGAARSLLPSLLLPASLFLLLAL